MTNILYIYTYTYYIKCSIIPELILNQQGYLAALTSASKRHIGGFLLLGLSLAEIVGQGLRLLAETIGVVTEEVKFLSIQPGQREEEIDMRFPSNTLW
jgi:hypothetical protein